VLLPCFIPPYYYGYILIGGLNFGDYYTDNEKKAARKLRFIRQNVVRSLFKPSDKKAVCTCLRHVKYGSESVKIMRNVETGQSSFAGLQTCGSVWDCPVCYAKISELRCNELTWGTGLNIAKFGRDSLVFVTFTFPHQRTDNLKDLLKRLSAATAYFNRHRDYRNLRDKIGQHGYTRSLEVTHGQNGWHPHLHEIWFCNTEQFDYYYIKQAVFDLWTKSCEFAGLPAPSWDHGIDVRDGEFAAAYAAGFRKDIIPADLRKAANSWGMEHEITKSCAKSGRNGSRTPWQLLDDYVAGDKQAGALFREYSAAFKGKQQVR
jgi:hypothetical protein